MGVRTWGRVEVWTPLSGSRSCARRENLMHSMIQSLTLHMLLLSFVLLASVPAVAQPIFFVDADATGAADGTSWADAFPGLQQALAAAEAGDEVWVAEGTYRPASTADRDASFVLVSGTVLYGGFDGTEATRDERDPDTHVTVLSGDLAAPVVSAQTPPPLTWELVGTGQGDLLRSRIEGIAFRAGQDPDGSVDTLYAVNVLGVFRFVPGANDWERTCAQSQCRAEFMTSTTEDYLLIGSRAGTGSDGERSTDGGFTWEHGVIGHGISVLFQSTLPALDGAVYACGSYSCSRSYDGGTAGSWLGGGPMGGEPAALAEVVPSASLPEGRLLGGVWNGVVFSGDGGQTWTPSALWAPGRFVVYSLTFAPESGHPFGGVAFAGVRDFGLGRPAVYRSEDGGQTWSGVLAVEAGAYGLESPDWIEVQTVGGTVFAGVRDDIPGTAPSVGPVLASADGGQTWKVVADSTNGWGGFGVRVFEVGRDGRLYVGTDRGVWRTAAPLPVAAESGPQDEPGKPEAELGAAYPNPSDGTVTLPLMLDMASEVRLTVYDVLGRAVVMLHEGWLAPGEHHFSLGTTALPSGIYLVRFQSETASLTRRLVVVR